VLIGRYGVVKHFAAHGDRVVRQRREELDGHLQDDQFTIPDKRESDEVDRVPDQIHHGLNIYLSEVFPQCEAQAAHGRKTGHVEAALQAEAGHGVAAQFCSGSIHGHADGYSLDDGTFHWRYGRACLSRGLKPETIIPDRG
jgi:hypothetical protein